MLKQLRLQNFKGWKDTGKISMAPITIFFGANSSGKSSIGQFLMMLKQTVESPDRKAVFNPGTNTSAVQLGSYVEMVYGRSLTKKISCEYRWDVQNLIKFKDAVSLKNFTVDSINFSATIGSSGSDEGKKTPVVEKLEYELFNKSDSKMTIGMAPHTSKKKYVVNAKKYSLIRNIGRVWYPSPPVRFYGFPDEVVGYYKNAEFVQQLNLAHENLFREIYYLGPLRTRTDRLYAWGGITPESVGFSGESTITAILAAHDRLISLGYKKNSKPLQEVVAVSLKSMGLIENFKVAKISDQRQEYEVKIRTKGSKNWVDLPDVGFGISQVLPVLVQCFYAPKNSIIIMEQPEIHLHPSAQAVLADVMIDVINSRENGTDRNIQLIIETHSEHFLRRLQRRIAEGSISNEKIATFFADTTEIPATLQPLQIDTFGNILNWPKNFFGDEMGDITAKAKAAMKRI